MRTTHFGYLAHCVEEVVARDPFNPDGHIALGLVYQNSLEPGLSKSGILSDFGQSEFEYRQAITLSPNRKNDEALKLLKSLPSLKKTAESENSKLGRKNKMRGNSLLDLQKKLLLHRWKLPIHNHFYLTRIRVEHNIQFGDLRAVVVVPSSNPVYDEAAFNALQSVLDDFRFNALTHYQFQFASENGQRWIECLGPDNVGSLNLLAFRNEPSEQVEAEARKFASHWTESRVRNYCIVETQVPNQLQDKTPPVGGHKIVGEDFPFYLPDELKPGYWRAGSYCNHPVKFAALAASGKWLLEYGNLDCHSYSDDDFLMHRISDAVFLSIRKYELAHVDDLDEKWKVRSRAKKPFERLVRDGAGKVVAFKSQLADGSELTVDLENGGNVETIRVDGQADAAWNKAYKESSLSLELANKALQEIDDSR